MNTVVDEKGDTLYGVDIKHFKAVSMYEAICPHCERYYIPTCKAGGFDCGGSVEGVLWMTAENATLIRLGVMPEPIPDP